ncbi:ATPase AAA [Porphyromonas crevioricanis]|uniref:ATPase AAA n=1 Tax=Porphyromonas crevioricanis TaxID=393921 RepID=A0A0A2FFI0_9PORP|nr:sigma-54 dependent transcriptional regulator [Porphyromonas crevioricanis]KGN88795.1 ATPase AAA [Porphyromonas crevioricanis]KGN96488.1 ATPase AAA [Porphyromonas crevioricanis]GAD07742.1 transcriptional regulator [Porphyromonas crevioricanis JCM 13913]SQH73584.1 Nitrogen assimilation regulatory protein [Porphyromonas crevioricanis]
MATNIDLRQVKQRFGIIGNSPILDRAIRIAVQVAPTDMSVLVTGESGAGKEFFPKIVHQYSSRKHNPYIAVNCGAIPEGTIDSELFGHRKGSFTGALADRKGYFEEANGGTIFLDEVGELPLSTQARLLRVLESGEFIPVGASVAYKTDVRIVAATNVNLRDAVAKGRFREDLLFRLNTVPIEVPSLRDRSEDIPLLFRKFALDTAERYQMPTLRLSSEAETVVCSYQWPGNIRELRNVAERMSVLEEERMVSADRMKAYLPDSAFADRHPVLLRSQAHSESHSFGSEREILFQVLFDMRKDMNELKDLVQDIMQGRVPITSVHGDSLMEHSTTHHRESKPIMLIDTDREGEAEEAALWQEEGEKFAEKSLTTIAEAEAQLVRLAMERYGVKNKKAAADALGISERTLYRKLKEYDIEDVQ